MSTVFCRLTECRAIGKISLKHLGQVEGHIASRANAVGSGMAILCDPRGQMVADGVCRQDALRGTTETMCGRRQRTQCHQDSSQNRPSASRMVSDELVQQWRAQTPALRREAPIAANITWRYRRTADANCSSTIQTVAANPVEPVGAGYLTRKSRLCADPFVRVKPFPQPLHRWHPVALSSENSDF